MSRLIDADALKYAIVEEGQRSRRYKLGDFWELNKDEIWNVIDAQPTIEPEQQWIPVTERLPEKPKNYPYCEIRRIYYLVSLESGCVKTLGYEFDRDEWQITGSPVVAWMPLPDPWKGRSDQ